MSTLDSSAPPNPANSNGNLPAIQYLSHPPPPNELVGYHQQQQSPMGHIPPPSPHTMQPAQYLPQPNAYMPAGNHYSAPPNPYEGYPPPPPSHQSPYGVPHFPHTSHPPSPYTQHHFEYHHDPFQYSTVRNYVTDPSGQSGPPGMKPRVTTTLWEDEGTLCFQVEAKGICVARREDNDFINGTKLLNVAGMSRGKRDGILKSEKARSVVKVGAMHLKGVWIPFDRALDFANKERIIDLLYPLFVQDIKSFLYHPANYARTNAVMAAAAHRQTQSGPPSVGPFTQQIPRRTSDIPQRPMMSDRSMSFPTPPSSASSITNGNADLPWISQTGLTLDTSLHGVTRSLPGTPATSPSSAVHASNQTYGALTDSQIHHRQSLNFEPSFKREAITQLHLSYPSNSQFSSRRASSASDMGPPPSAVHSRLNTLEKDLDNKHDSLPETNEEGGYPGELHYNVPPGTPIAASGNQVYHNTPSIVAMKGRVENPGTPTHGQSPGANGVNWPSKHDATTQSDYSISSGQHSRQLSYQMRSEDQPQMVSQNGVSRNIFDSTPLDRDNKITSLDYNHGDEVLSNELSNGHNLSHGPLPAIKQEGMIKDGPPSKRRRTINQDSLPYGMGGPSPPQTTADLSIPEGNLASNGSVLNTSDPASWNMSSSYADEYGTPVLGDPTNGRKRPPSRK